MQVRGYSKLYDNIDDYGWPYFFFSIFWFLFFIDGGIYWVHRWLHIPVIYKALHKPHHKVRLAGVFLGLRCIVCAQSIEQICRGRSEEYPASLEAEPCSADG